MPIITGGVIEKNGKYLLVQEAQEKCRGQWNIPAGHLDAGETIFDAAIREVKEETGCEVELTGITQIANRIIENNTWIGVIFSTRLMSDSISYNTAEILNAKWFSYKEIINMRDSLRNPDCIITAIDNLRNGNIADLNLIKIINTEIVNE